MSGSTVRAAILGLAALGFSGCAASVIGPDAGAPNDAGQAVRDAGTVDAGALDAGVIDAGPTDFDAGFLIDAGSIDAGPTGPCAPNATLSCSCAVGTGSLRCAPDGTAWSSCSCESYAREFAVSPSGSDTASGTLADPFLTLAHAESAVEASVVGGAPAGGTAVWIRGGIYELNASVAIGAAGSGNDGGWITWRGYPGEVATLVGGHAIDASAFSTVTSASPIWSRLDPSAQGNVQVVDLNAQGVTDFGTLKQRGFCQSGNHAALELFVDGAPMTLARWPDADTNTAMAASVSSTSVDIYGTGVVPDVTGHYVQQGTQDGVSVFQRSGLVGGLQYNLHRWSSANNTAWFLTTDASGYPSDANPWWYSYTSGLMPMSPTNRAVGAPSFTDPTAIQDGFALVVSSSSASQFTYAGTRPSRWTQASDVWIHGMLMFDWADCHQSVSAIDTGAQTLTLAQAATYGIAANQPWYAENLLEEITEPGEWWLDRSSGLLYFWPPTALAGHQVVVSTLDAPLISMNGAANVALEDLTLEVSRSNLVAVSQSTRIRLRGLTLQSSGTDSAVISGEDVGVEHAHILNSGNGGVVVNGGDRPSLTAGNNYVENSNIHDFGRWEATYRPAISLNDVGNRASHNLLHASPHAAILYGGNNHLIELNDIHDVCRFAADSGAIYAGRDWGARGNVIRNNYIHQIASVLSTDVVGVYLDDCLSGIRVEGNIFDGVAGYSILHGGGRDNIMVNNVFANYGVAIAADSRCYDTIPPYAPGDLSDYLPKLEAENYQQPPWSIAYPACAAIPDDWTTIIAPDAGWLLPQGCVFSDNVGDGSGTWFTTSGPKVIPSYAEIANDLPDAGALFVNEDAGNLNLLPGSAALSLPGFETIPFSSIGIQP